jgi:molybdopterin adenylyltransferase
LKLYKVGIVTLSDKGYQGLRKDESGNLIRQLIQAQFEVIHQTILPDEKNELSRLLIEWCDTCDLILTTGGTGLGVRDITPEATLSVAEKEIPGISEGMRMMGIKKTPFAMLSRAVAVQRGKTLIINLPGSPKGVRENLTYLMPILSHALDILTDHKTEH